jgi:hypothetical protein
MDRVEQSAVLIGITSHTSTQRVSSGNRPLAGVRMHVTQLNRHYCNEIYTTNADCQLRTTEFQLLAFKVDIQDTTPTTRASREI